MLSLSGAAGLWLLFAGAALSTSSRLWAQTDMQPDIASRAYDLVFLLLPALVAGLALGRASARMKQRPGDTAPGLCRQLAAAVQTSVEHLVSENTVGVLVLDEHGSILLVNPAAARLLGLAADRPVGAALAIPVGGTARTELDIVAAQGECGVAELIVSETVWLGRKAYLALLFDITEHKAAEARMRRLAFADPLTELPNRSLFVNRLEHTLRLAKRQRVGFAVIFIDIDRFKGINDTFGHAFGDTLLRHVAMRLKQTLRESDTVARIGGDEFTLIVYGIDNDRDAEIVGGKLRTAMLAPFTIDGDELFITVSFGIALYPQHSEVPEELMRYADGAMYAAKQTRNGAFNVYGQDADVLARARLRRGASAG
jgi:diguanylate cyclase (GGDEF)-like protein